MKALIEKLPNDYRKDWSKFEERMPTKNLVTLQEWLHEEARHACKTTNLTVKRPESGQKYDKGRINVHANENDAPSPLHDDETCLLCESNCETIVTCPRFVGMSLSQKWDLVKTHRICRSCLKKHPMKFPYKCRDAKTCGVNGCPAKHQVSQQNKKKL